METNQAQHLYTADVYDQPLDTYHTIDFQNAYPERRPLPIKSPEVEPIDKIHFTKWNAITLHNLEVMLQKQYASEHKILFVQLRIGSRQIQTFAIKI